MVDVHIGRRRLSLASLQKRLLSTQLGAQVYFSGVVRDANLGREVVAIEYDVCRPLALQSLAEIGQEALALATPESLVCLYHRVGRVECGQSSILVGVASPHRAQAYRMSQYCMDEIKRRVPIWKCEIYADGSRQWLSGTPLEVPRA